MTTTTTMNDEEQRQDREHAQHYAQQTRKPPVDPVLTSAAELDLAVRQQIAHWRAWSMEPEAIYVGHRDFAEVRSRDLGIAIELRGGEPPRWHGLPVFFVMDCYHLKVAPAMPRLPGK